jgi:hypothetical protein
MSETHILVRLLQMYFPRNWELGPALSELVNFKGGGGVFEPPQTLPLLRHCFGFSFFGHMSIVGTPFTSTSFLMAKFSTKICELFSYFGIMLIIIQQLLHTRTQIFCFVFCIVIFYVLWFCVSRFWILVHVSQQCKNLLCHSNT